MAPSWTKDMEELKLSFNFMSEELSKVVKQQASLMHLIGEIQQLKAIIKEKDEKIEELEKRVEDLEQYTKKEDVVISGLKTKYRTYARAMAEDKGEDASPDDLLSLEQQVIKFFRSKDILLDSKTIAACHTIPQKQNSSSDKLNKRPRIIMRFVSTKYKTELLKVVKKLKGTDVFVNEHLTKKNAEIAYQARILKKEKKIQATWTRNCKILIKLNGSPEQAKVLTIKNVSELEKYR